MATRSFVYSALVIMLVMIIVASALTIAFAEEVYMVQGTITGFNITPEGIEVEVTDITGNIRAYYDSGSFVIGEPVFITLLGDEIVDVIYVNRLVFQRAK